MRVTLVNPPRFFEIEPNLGLCYIASVMGRLVTKLPLSISQSTSPLGSLGMHSMKLSKYNRGSLENQARLIGMTGTYHTYYALEMLDIFKKILPETKIVVGGPHFTFTAEDVLSNYDAVDYVVRGEGEYTMMKLATALEKDCVPMRQWTA